MAKIIPELIVSDMTRSMDFYASLGFVQDNVGIIDDKGSQWYSLAMGESNVWLLRQDIMEGFDGSIKRANGVHLYLSVDDVDGLYEKLKAGGQADIVHGPETKWYGMREFVVADPDGYIWTLNMPVSERAEDAVDGQDD